MDLSKDPILPGSGKKFPFFQIARSETRVKLETARTELKVYRLRLSKRKFGR
ncbi:hypothetical protein LEP1GSC193_4376 [Leptospira alstonii serovar Pingchang str. 80-412]|uniref:Uncharacterized protein n=2 Tax=Leptospira alstonii TaxID=28452 RepID=M6CSD3_9LEPT|nr:hypothetical protein LEP1GSC194_2141 [Leptospira alstonii serovar Sichuan str. 79601]EQA80223.1 hypothetical protein LEP1GSC193_4376 [Leptospira alstonii serovar Pingchang str. 80-412]